MELELELELEMLSFNSDRHGSYWDDDHQGLITVQSIRFSRLQLSLAHGPRPIPRKMENEQSLLFCDEDRNGWVPIVGSMTWSRWST